MPARRLTPVTTATRARSGSGSWGSAMGLSSSWGCDERRLAERVVLRRSAPAARAAVCPDPGADASPYEPTQAVPPRSAWNTAESRQFLHDLATDQALPKSLI